MSEQGSDRPGVVRSVTINLAGFRGDWFGGRFAALIKGLRGLEPDVVCFQEATLVWGDEPYNQAGAVGAALGLPSVAFAPYGNPIEAVSREVGGVAIASRWPIGYSENLRLPEGAAEGPDNRVVLNRPDPVFPSDHFGLYVELAFDRGRTTRTEQEACRTSRAETLPSRKRGKPARP